jgi:hypothetical protein
VGVNAKKSGTTEEASSLLCKWLRKRGFFVFITSQGNPNELTRDTGGLIYEGLSKVHKTIFRAKWRNNGLGKKGIYRETTDLV